MRIDSATYDGGTLMLSVPYRDGVRFAYEFKAGDYELKRKPKKRSLDANAYAWVLIDKLSEALGMPKTEIYRRAIKDIGGVSETLTVHRSAVEKLVEGWTHNGLGWQADISPSEIPMHETVILYYGSSVYDKGQMSRLVDSLVQDCRSCGIETKSREEVESLLNGWRK